MSRLFLKFRKLYKSKSYTIKIRILLDSKKGVKLSTRNLNVVCWPVV